MIDWPLSPVLGVRAARKFSPIGNGIWFKMVIFREMDIYILGVMVWLRRLALVWFGLVDMLWRRYYILLS